MTSAVDRFGKLARTLGLLGYPPIPIIPGTKAPRPKGWQHGEFADRGPEFADDFTGIRTRSTPAIDIDVSDAELVRQIKGILVDVLGCREIDLPARVGMAPRTLLVCRTDVPFSKRSTAAYELPTDQVVDGKRKPSKVEVLADGQQFVAYAIHPITGQSYTWLTAATPLNTWQWELVHINAAQADEFVRRCDALLDKHGKRLGGTSAPRTAVDPPGEVDPQAREDATRYDDTPANRARLISALKALHPDADPSREGQYMKVVRGLHSTGWADWLELAESWASGELHGITSTEYNKKTFRQDVKGLDNNKPKAIVTVASIFALAKAAGWVDPRSDKGGSRNDPSAPDEAIDPLDPLAALQRWFVTDEQVAEMTETSMIWRDIIAASHLAVWSAPANGGKTTLAKLAAGELASAHTVLFFQEDASAGDLPALHQHAKDHGYRLLNSTLANSTPDEQILVLRGLARDCARLDGLVLFFDTLKKYTDLMSKGGTRAFFQLMRSLTQRGATVVLLGHTNKHKGPDGKLMFEGVGDVRNDVDELLYIEATDKDAAGIVTLTIKPDKVRCAVREATFELDTKTMHVRPLAHVVNVGAVLEANRRLQEDAHLIDAVKQALAAGGMNYWALIERTATDTGESRNAVRRVVDRYLTEDPSDPRALWTETRLRTNNTRYIALKPRGQL